MTEEREALITELAPFVPPFVVSVGVRYSSVEQRLYFDDEAAAVAALEAGGDLVRRAAAFKNDVPEIWDIEHKYGRLAIATRELHTVHLFKRGEAMANDLRAEEILRKPDAPLAVRLDAGVVTP